MYWELVLKTLQHLKYKHKEKLKIYKCTKYTQNWDIQRELR
jgi:hypothetical protein